MAFQKLDDHHWDFLEEIEAPQWVDLSTESKEFHQDSDEKWFFLSHPFHQFSARQLKFAFLHPKEGSGILDFHLQEASSPKLPSSVSRSRGKYYVSRNWEKENKSFLSGKKHPIETLGAKSVNPGISFNISKECSSSMARVTKDHESKSTESTITNNSKVMSYIYDQRKTQPSVSESNSTSELLSVIRTSLRKSCVTRQASRVEIKDGRNVYTRKSCAGKSNAESSSNVGHDTMRKDDTNVKSKKYCSSKSSIRSSSSMGGYEATNKDGNTVYSRKTSSTKSSIGSSTSMGGYEATKKDDQNVNSRKTSSSKSSVGSSSRLGYDVMNKELTRKEWADRTPESRNASEFFQASTVKSNILNDQLSRRTSFCPNRKGDKIVIARTARRQEALKSKLICQPTRTTALLPHRVNQQCPATALIKGRDKMQVGWVNQCVAKENVLGQQMSQECGGRKIVAEIEEMKQRKIIKAGRTGLVGLKGKANDQIEGRSSRNPVQKVYLR